jgi:hypothetical protein
VPATPAPSRDDIGPTSTGEVARLRALVDGLQAEVRQRDIKIVGLESEIVELKARVTELEAAADDIPPFLRRVPS